MINCCMQFVTLQALNQIFTSENNHMQNNNPSSFVKMHCDWSKMCFYETPNDMDQVTIKVSPTRPVNETENHRLSHRYWDGIEKMKVKHFVDCSGLK